jgi:hypothetical protein
MQLQKIRKAYDQNYAALVKIIQEMGGEENIKYHRKRKSPLYRKLIKLQRNEHKLDSLESRFHVN